MVLFPRKRLFKRRRYPVEAPAQKQNGRILSAIDAAYSPCTVTVTGYGPGGFEEINLTKIDDIAAISAKWPVVWVDVDGLGNSQLIMDLGKACGLDQLALEDIFDTRHPPKIEEYEHYLFLVLKNGILGEIFETEQISVVLGQKTVLTFQERPGESFSRVRNRIRNGGRIRQFGSDYLTYAIIDAVIESYYPILDAMKRRLDEVEDSFLGRNAIDVIRQIHDVKNDLLFLHSALWPIHDITLTLANEDAAYVKPAIKHYLRDCQDQAKRVTDLSEFYRLLASDLMNTYLAFNDSHANEVMKVLTMVATIFIPLSFIAALYGMNFDPAVSPYNMPELKMRYGYPAVLILMLTITVFILFMFWRRGWLGKRHMPSR